jgi:hypothetical protein
VAEKAHQHWIQETGRRLFPRVSQPENEPNTRKSMEVMNNNYIA